MKRQLDEIIAKLFEAGPHQPNIAAEHDVLYDSLLNIVEQHPVGDWKAELDKWLVAEASMVTVYDAMVDAESADHRESAQNVLAIYHVIAARAALTETLPPLH